MLPTTGADNIRLAALDWITPVVLPRIFAVLELTTPSDCLRLTFIYALIRMNQKLLILSLHDNTAVKYFSRENSSERRDSLVMFDFPFMPTIIKEHFGFLFHTHKIERPVEEANRLFTFLGILLGFNPLYHFFLLRVSLSITAYSFKSWPLHGPTSAFGSA